MANPSTSPFGIANNVRPFFFFFKQKTAYEMRTYWSSDVCSSDLNALAALSAADHSSELIKSLADSSSPESLKDAIGTAMAQLGTPPANEAMLEAIKSAPQKLRSEERRVGKEGRCGSARRRERKKE